MPPKRPVPTPKTHDEVIAIIKKGTIQALQTVRDLAAGAVKHETVTAAEVDAAIVDAVRLMGL